MADFCGVGQKMGYALIYWKPFDLFMTFLYTEGDIVSISIFGQTIVVLNSVDAAIDMLEKKSVIYSDRPVLQMGGELVGWKKTLVLVPYGDRFRNYRRLFHKTIGSNATISKYSASEEMETHKLLKRILANPDDLGAHVRK